MMNILFHVQKTHIAYFKVVNLSDMPVKHGQVKGARNNKHMLV